MKLFQTPKKKKLGNKRGLLVWAVPTIGETMDDADDSDAAPDSDADDAAAPAGP